jgi:hypothetical protein
MPDLLRNGVAFVTILFAAACGESSVGLSPTGPTAPAAPSAPTASKVIVESTRLVDSTPLDPGLSGCGLQVTFRNANGETVSFRAGFDALGATSTTRIASAGFGMKDLPGDRFVIITSPWAREGQPLQPLACSEINRFELSKLELCEP